MWDVMFVGHERKSERHESIARGVYWQEGTTRLHRHPEKGEYLWIPSFAASYESSDALLQAALDADPPLVRDVDEWHYQLLNDDGVVVGHGDHYASKDLVVGALESILGDRDILFAEDEPGVIDPVDAILGKASATGAPHCPTCDHKLTSPLGRTPSGVRKVRSLRDFEVSVDLLGSELAPCAALQAGDVVIEHGSDSVVVQRGEELYWLFPGGQSVKMIGGGGTVSDLVANSWLDAIGNATSYSEASFNAKMHTGDPGSAGTNNAATETTRQAVSFGAASSRAMSNDSPVEWTNVSTSETVTWLSFWDHISAGNFLGRDDLSSSAALTSGDTLRIPTGDLDLTIT